LARRRRFGGRSADGRVIQRVRGFETTAESGACSWAASRGECASTALHLGSARFTRESEDQGANDVDR
jgi:hypothetical protein